jgi:hypothetical protein
VRRSMAHPPITHSTTYYPPTHSLPTHPPTYYPPTHPLISRPFLPLRLLHPSLTSPFACPTLRLPHPSPAPPPRRPLARPMQRICGRVHPRHCRHGHCVLPLTAAGATRLLAHRPGEWVPSTQIDSSRFQAHKLIQIHTITNCCLPLSAFGS